MKLAYGSHVHDDNECQLSIARSIWRDVDGQRRGYIERWTIEGMLRGTGADLVANLTTQIAALEAAYATDAQDLILYESNGSTETGHTLANSGTTGGTRVVSGPSFPSGRGAEYATFRRYTIVVEANVEDGSNDLIAYSEAISTHGTGAGKFVVHGPLQGSPIVQITAERTPVIVTQEGMAVGRAAYPSIPAPVSSIYEHEERRRIIRKGAERMADGTYRNYEISWHYEFTAPTSSITSIPSFDGSGGAGGGVAAHQHSGVDITSSYVREPYIDPLIARVSDIATYVGTLQLDGLLDVNISAVADKELLTWDSGTSKWINRTAIEADIYTVVGTHNPFIDLQPAHTGTAQVIKITPSAAIAGGAEWDGIQMDGAALDPSGAGAIVHGVHIDFTGVSLTNDPEVHGLQIDLPTTYTGEAHKGAGHFSGGGVIAEFCDVELHAANFTQGQVNVDWNAASVGAGDTQDIYDARIRGQGSTGGDVHVFAASRISGGSVNVTLLGTYNDVGIVHQHTGIFSNCDKAWKFNGGFTDVTVAFGDAGTDTQIFTSDNDYIYIGDAGKFSMLMVILAIASSKNCLLEWEYSNGAGGWPSFGPSDQTHGFQEDGVVAWNSAALAGWATEAVNGSTQYWIRAKRTRNVLGTPPTEDTIQILEPVIYYWDSSGDLSIHALAVDTISERTAAAGVTIDGCLIKDGKAANSDLLDGYEGAALAALAENELITGDWAFVSGAKAFFDAAGAAGGEYVWAPADNILALVSGGYVAVGGGTPGTASTVGDLFVTNRIEVDGGSIYLDAPANDSGIRFRQATSTRAGIDVEYGYDQMVVHVSPSVGRQLVLGAFSGSIRDYDHAPQASPTLYVHSLTDPNTANNQWWSITHDTVNATYSLGTGVHKYVAGDVLLPNSGKLYLDSGAAIGTEYITSGADTYTDIYHGAGGGVRFYDENNLLLTIQRYSGILPTLTKLVTPVRFEFYAGATRAFNIQSSAVVSLIPLRIYGDNNWSGWGLGVGANPDVKAYYDGTNFQILPAALGTGYVNIFKDTDAASVAMLTLEGDRATETDDDEIYMSWKLANDADEQTEFARISAVATDVSDGTEDGALGFKVMKDGALTETFRMHNGGALVTSTHHIEFNDAAKYIGWSGVNMTFVTDAGVFHFSGGDIQVGAGKKILFGGVNNYIWLDGVNITIVTLADVKIGNDIDVTGNIIVSGTVDAVDIAAFKAAYDAHDHDANYYTEAELDGGQLDNRYYTEAEVNAIAALYLPLAGGTMSGNIVMGEDNWIGDNTSTEKIVFDHSFGRIEVIGPLYLTPGDGLWNAEFLEIEELGGAPAARANHGKLWTAADNKLYFQDGAGVSHEIKYV